MTIIREDCLRLARDVLKACKAFELKVATAESCTGGMIAAFLTDVPGSSASVDRGFVTYSNEAKTEMLGVPAEVIAADGAVSESVARAMAEGVLAHSHADISVSVTGIAGPGGGSPEKPVGLVHMASARRGRETVHEEHRFEGNRDTVRQQAAAAALRLMLLNTKED
jgi:nicotinamide-nucleotide amidase